MSLKKFIVFLLGIFCTYQSSGQVQGDLIQSRVLILLDRSSSMTESWSGGKEKSKAADEFIRRLVDSIYAVNPEVEIGLRVFGHQYPTAENNCYDSKMEVLFSKDNRTQIALRLNDLHPLGVTPIAYSLEQAAKYDLINENRNAYCIVLVTDGGESCGGNICDVMTKFLKNKVHFRPYIVSLEDNPPLKTLYSCMGDYLQVLKAGDMSPAVGVIVEAFRPILKISVSDYKELQKTPVVVPSILKVPVPEIKVIEPPKDTTPKIPEKEKVVFTKPPPIPPGEKISELPSERLKLFTISIPKAGKLNTEELPVFTLQPIVIDTPVVIPKRVADNIGRIQPGRPKELTIHIPTAAKLSAADAGLPPIKLVIDTPVTPKTADKIARLTLAHPKQFNVIFVIEDHIFQPRALPPPPQFKIDLPEVKPEPVVKKAPEPVKPAKKPEKEPTKAEYKVETEDAKETTLEIYFTNGKGKFFNSTPQVQLLDPGTNQMVKKFYRTIDENGNPDPQLHILPGRYDIAFTETRGVASKNVEVVAGKKNKIYVVIKNTSLSFYYYTPGSLAESPRQIKEFSAIVTERNKAQGRINNQKCSDIVEYEPGNYHIEINTFPVDIRNVDLDFNQTEIGIPQPGFAKFNNLDGKAHDITLWRRLGDKFLQFYRLDIKSPVSQHLPIQPGEYQVHYQKGPGQRGMAEKVVTFLIKATEETEVILK